MSKIMSRRACLLSLKNYELLAVYVEMYAIRINQSNISSVKTAFCRSFWAFFNSYVWKPVCTADQLTQ